VVDECGLSVFDLLRYRRYDHAAILCAFDLIELDGDDLRSLAIEHRKGRLERILRLRATARSSTSTFASSVARALSRSGSAPY